MHFGIHRFQGRNLLFSSINFHTSDINSIICQFYNIYIFLVVASYDFHVLLRDINSVIFNSINCEKTCCILDVQRIAHTTDKIIDLLIERKSQNTLSNS